MVRRSLIMADTRDIQSIVESAEQAAAAGDYAAAEDRLREAARLQEATLGALHPDLANTLNNLGVVCDITNKPDEAERCYRRAYEIAKAAFAPDHAFVATSEKNLRDFCAARGRPFESPVSAPAVAPERQPQATAPPQLPTATTSSVEIPPRVETQPRVDASPRVETPLRVEAPLLVEARKPYVLWAFGAAFIIVIAVLMMARSGRAPQPASDVTADPSSDTGSPPVERKPAVAPPVERSRIERVPASKEKGIGSLIVDEASLCRDLSTTSWRCEPAGSPVTPGPMFFYTRIKSTRDTTVEHRWYLGNRLRQAVELDIGANPSRGYRTFSRNTINVQDAGEWRVELRASDGSLLHEERFTVR
jgi:hypothetical protein